MADIITVEGEDDLFKILGRIPVAGVHLLRAAVEDIADEIERAASNEAPFGEEGRIVEHPVDRDELFVGFSRAGVARGTVTAGTVVARLGLTVPDQIPHKFVYSGTGIFGPKGVPYTAKRPGGLMVFDYMGRHFKLKSVRGQRPNPYLDRAFRDVEAFFVPVRLLRLRQELELIT